MFKSSRSADMLDMKMRVLLAEEYGYKGGDVTVLCKCNTPQEAHNRALSAGLGSQWFLPDCCENIKDDSGLDLFKDNDIAICVDGNNFLSQPDISAALLR